MENSDNNAAGESPEIGNEDVNKSESAEVIHAISYPKSGRTWLRSLIGKYLADNFDLPENRLLETEFMTASSGLGKLSFSHDGSQMSVGTPYHELGEVMGDYRGSRVLFMAREIKDTLVSAYFQATKRIEVFEGDISEFIRHERYGTKKILTFYQHWNRRQDDPARFLFLRYEDLHAGTPAVLEKVLEFLGVQNIDQELVGRSVEFCSFRNLQKAEQENRFGNKILAPKRDGDEESFKVRKGKVGNYSEYLSAKDIAYIDDEIHAFGNPFDLAGSGA